MRKAIFDAVRAASPKVFNEPGNIHALDNLLDSFGVPRDDAVRTVSPAGIALMHRFEGCKLKAYPDPGSKDGKPWTIGWGATGPDIGPGTVWTQAQADARFERDIEKYAAEVSKAIGSTPTTQSQFDALVSFHYNTGAINKATLTKKHNAGDYAGAAAEFRKWIYNDGKPMAGLMNRREAEAELYRS
ncbi:lysozyme [Novosphingobium mathurense]|uniref:Lysozyme n=1 Tax=Novosphingobium mathurense TaxID=428990 RepID=A0A1U6I6R0_9SPHN|nr:Phage-related lysozyme (muramidase), GH24 family [Novosphingobium mathurense]